MVLALESSTQLLLPKCNLPPHFTYKYRINQDGDPTAFHLARCKVLENNTQSSRDDIKIISMMGEAGMPCILLSLLWSISFFLLCVESIFSSRSSLVT